MCWLRSVMALRFWEAKDRSWTYVRVIEEISRYKVLGIRSLVKYTWLHHRL